ncbi:MAG: hypothetical protein ACT6S0_14345 [Roseateles sp.]|uniref:hypothetical protein n=1 Tax=Roseateles sp. TaxID=1971397 RepID=UPI004037E02F
MNGSLKLAMMGESRGDAENFWPRCHGAMAVSLASGTIQKMLEDTARCATFRLFPVLLLAVLTPMASAAPSVPAALACQSTVLNDEQAEAVCSLPGSFAGKDVRFKAHFLGSHDDSIVSLRLPTLNGAPVICRPGSKTESRFEDGEVTLDCGFVAPEKPASVKVNISLHHPATGQDRTGDRVGVETAWQGEPCIHMA